MPSGPCSWSRCTSDGADDGAKEGERAVIDKRLRLILLSVGLLVMLGLAVLLRSSPPLYRMTILPSLGGQFTLPCAINDHGQVAGFAEVGQGSYHLFMWDRAGGMQDLGPVCNNLVDMNNAGQIVGTMIDPSGNGQAFLRDPASGIRLLGTLGGTSSHAHAINNLGQVVGRIEFSSYVNHAFIWDKANGMRDLGPGRAWAINDAGQVIVFSSTGPVIMDADRGAIVADLRIPATGLLRINNAGWVAGVVRPSVGKPGKLDVVTWHHGSGLRTLMQVDEGSAGNGAINDVNQVLIVSERRATRLWGRTLIPARSQYYLQDPQRGLIRLDKYLPAGPRESLWLTDLNNEGCIVGALQSEDGRSWGVLLEPIPERWGK